MVETVREFARAELLPQAIEIDREARFPVETFRKMAELGLLGLPVPEQYEGAACDAMTSALVVEELAKVCGSTALGVAAHTSLCLWPLYTFGNDEQRARWVPDLASGRKLGAFGLTEANAGSDAGSTRTSAVLDGKEWVLNGTKCFITNANYSETFVVTAVTDREAGTKGGITSFILERGMEGFSIHKGDEKLGMRGSDWGELEFADCRVPRENVLGEVGHGFVNFMKTLDGGRVGIAALALGLAEGAYERSLGYAQEREAFGKPIAKQQAVAFMLADMAIETDAMRFLAWKAAWTADRGEDCTREASLARLYAGEYTARITDNGVQVLGGHGYTRDHPVELWFRNGLGFEILEGLAMV